MIASQSRGKLVVGDREMPMTFSRREGGNKTGGGSKYRPGGGLPERARPGAGGSVENLTLGGEYDPELHATDFAFLEASVNKPCTYVEQTLDEDGAVVGPPETWTGLIEGVNRGEYDANSSDVREFEVEINTDGEKT